MQVVEQPCSPKKPYLSVVKNGTFQYRETNALNEAEKWSWPFAIGFMVTASLAAWVGFLTILLV